LASAGWTKKAGVPVDASVAAIFEPIWPLLPTPVTITRPLIPRIVSIAVMNGSPNPFVSAFARAVSPSASMEIVFSADWTGPAGSSDFVARWLMAVRYSSRCGLSTHEVIWRRIVHPNSGLPGASGKFSLTTRV
jgi:hypothetical protein